MARGRRRISTHIARESTDSIVTNHMEGGLADQGGQGGDGHVRDRDAAADRQADRQGDEGGRDEGAGRGQGQDNPSWVDGQSKPGRRQPVPWRVTKRRGIVPDGLVQTRLSNFVKAFPNLGRGDGSTNRIIGGVSVLANKDGERPADYNLKRKFGCEDPNGMRDTV